MGSSSTMRTRFVTSRSFHADALVGTPASHFNVGGLINPPDASVGDLASRSRVRVSDDLPLPRLVRETVADLKLHRQDTACGRWR